MNADGGGLRGVVRFGGVFGGGADCFMTSFRGHCPSGGGSSCGSGSVERISVRGGADEGEDEKPGWDRETDGFGGESEAEEDLGKVHEDARCFGYRAGIDISFDTCRVSCTTLCAGGAAGTGGTGRS